METRASIQLTKGVSNILKIKHVDVAFFHILDEQKNGKIKTYWVPGGDQLADTFTKSLPRVAFEKNKGRIGLWDVEEVEKEYASKPTP